MVRVWGHHRILGIVKQISSVPKELTADWWKPFKESCVLISLDGPDSWLPCFVAYYLIHLKRASLVSKGFIYLHCILWVILLNIHISIYHRHFSVSIAIRTFTVIQNCHHCPFSPSEMLSSLTSISSFFSVLVPNNHVSVSFELLTPETSLLEWHSEWPVLWYYSLGVICPWKQFVC